MGSFVESFDEEKYQPAQAFRTALRMFFDLTDRFSQTRLGLADLLAATEHNIVTYPLVGGDDWKFSAEWTYHLAHFPLTRNASPMLGCIHW